MKALEQIKQALEESGLPYEIKMGSRHLKFLLQGRIVAVMPKHGKAGESTAHKRRTLNALKAIERAAREKGSVQV